MGLDGPCSVAAHLGVTRSPVPHASELEGSAVALWDKASRMSQPLALWDAGDGSLNALALGFLSPQLLSAPKPAFDRFNTGCAAAQGTHISSPMILEGLLDLAYTWSGRQFDRYRKFSSNLTAEVPALTDKSWPGLRSVGAL